MNRLLAFPSSLVCKAKADGRLMDQKEATLAFSGVHPNIMKHQLRVLLQGQTREDGSHPISSLYQPEATTLYELHELLIAVTEKCCCI